MGAKIWAKTAAVGGALLIGVAQAGSALTMTATGGGISAVVGNYACASATSPGLCAIQKTFDYFTPGTASGTITVDTNTNLATVALSIASFSFDDVSAPVGGVDEILFTNVFYSVTVPVIDNGSGFYNQTGGAVLGTVTGTYEQKLGGATAIAAAAFSESVSYSNLVCPTGGIGQCGLTAGNGAAGLYDLNVGSGPALTKFVNTLNVNVIPEPATGILLALGLAIVAARRRSAP